MSRQAYNPGTDTDPLLGAASLLTLGDSTTVLLSGEFDAGTSQGLTAALDDACALDIDVVVDMTGVKFLDGAALRRIERAAVRVRMAGRSLRVANPPRVVVRLLHAVNALQLLDS